MKFVHLYSGSDGQSHFRDVEVPLSPMGRVEGYELTGVLGAQIRQIPDGLEIDYHPEPRRQLVIQLSGSGEIDCRTGEDRIFGPGDVLLADDRTGRGHKSRPVTQPRRQLLIYIEENALIPSGATSSG